MTTNQAPGLSILDRRRARSKWGIGLLIGLTTTAPLAVDMFLPSMPNMAEEFEAPTATVQLAVTLFLLAFAASQLVYGPVSDRFGRRPALIAGLVLFIAGGVLSLFAWSAEALILGRIVQGIGGGAGPAIGRAMVLDIFGRDRAAQILAYMAMATPLAPTLAPIVGGVLQDLFDWRAVFVTLIGIGVFLLVAYRATFPETNVRQDSRALDAVQMSRNYRALLTHRTFLAYALAMGLMFSGQLVFISGSSFVLIEELGLSPAQFGFGFGFVAMGLISGAFLSSRLVVRWADSRVVLFGAALAASGAAIMATLAWSGVASPWAVLLPMFFFAGGNGIVRPAAMAGALIPFERMAGLASALLGFCQMVFATLYNIGFSQLIELDQVSLASAIAAAAACNLTMLLLLRPSASSGR